MDSKTRAEKIVVDYVNLYHVGMMPDAPKLIEMIVSQIEEAQREAKEYWDKFEKGCGDVDCDLTKDLLVNGIQKVRIYEAKKYREGFAAAREKAAEIIKSIDDCPCHGSPVNCKTWIAWERIRKMEPDK